MIRTITYTVTADTRGITPNTIQWAGMQYEDCATEVVFDLSALDRIQGCYYRIDFNSDGAGYHPSENLTLNNEKISRKIPKFITQYGGELQITAVVTSEKTTEVIYSYPVKVRFTAVEKSQHGDETVEGNISMMEASVKDMTRRCEDASSDAARFAESAENDRALTEEARFALEHDSEFVFLGGDASGSVSTELVIDGVMSDASKNPVMNKTVKAYVDRAKDFIVEQGTAEVMVNEGADDEFVATWTYRKWNSGIAECWTASNRINCPISTVWGSLFVSDQAFPQIPYPITFVSAPTFSFELAYLPHHMTGYCTVPNTYNQQLTPAIKVWSAEKRTANLEVTARISVIGRWK